MHLTLRAGLATVGGLLAIACAGCGGSTSTGTNTPDTGSTATDSATTAGASATTTGTSTSTDASSGSGLSYTANNIPVSVGGFTFTFTANLTVGAATTSTDGAQPPYVKVVAPISGTATLTNTAAGYTANANSIPLVGVYAVYSQGSPICGSYLNPPEFHPGPGGVCGVDVAEFAVACANTIQSFASGQSATLVPWAQYALNFLQPASPRECSNVSNFQPPTTFQTNMMTNATALAVIGQLSSPPDYWALLNEGSSSQSGADPAAGGGADCQSDEFYIQGGQFIGQVLSSQPAGLTGCLGHP